MSDLRPFALEDFFAEFDYRPGLLKLASSDAAPWTLQEVLDQCPDLKSDLAQLSLNYPDVRELVPALEKFCQPPAQMEILVVSGAAEAIFRPFEQRGADRAGLGLGLAISRQAIESDGGKISLRDIPGKGCVFIVEMPLATSATTDD